MDFPEKRASLAILLYSRRPPMFPAKQRTRLLKLNDRAILASTDYLFSVPDQEGTSTADFPLCDRVYD